MSRRRGTRDTPHPLYAFAAWAYVAMLAVPLYYLVVSSFKDNVAIFNQPFALPERISFEKYTTAITDANLDHGLKNSLLITAGASVLTLVLAVPAAYALARAQNRLGRLVERIFSTGFLIPAFAALIPTVLLAIELQLFQTRTFLILLFPAQALPLAVILLTQFMRAVPDEMWESASIDGAGSWSIIARIYAPMTLPGIVTVVILNFLAFWNEFLFSLTILGPDPAVRTSQVALPTLVSTHGTDFGMLAAGAIITMLPVYAVYIVLQRKMTHALIEGAVKS
jgi:multiple sugar transport system permease protein